jgi:hypothetical protein
MKKGFAVLLIALLMMMPAAAVVAAPGGEYTIDELNMSVTFPTDWVIFTNDITNDDEDLADYGFSSADEMKQALFVGTDMYLYAYYDIFMAGVLAFEDEHSKEIGYLAQMDSLSTNIMALAANFTQDMGEDGWEYSNFELYENDENAYLKWDMSTESDDFICYGVGYMTVMDGQYIACFYAKFDELIAPDRQKFDELIDQVTYEEDALRAVYKANADHDTDIADEAMSVLANDAGLVRTMAYAAAACFAVVIGIIVLIIGVSSRHKKKAGIAAMQLAQTQESAQAENLSVTKNNETGRQDESICAYCNQKVPAGSAYCPHCGAKTE